MESIAQICVEGKHRKCNEEWVIYLAGSQNYGDGQRFVRLSGRCDCECHGHCGVCSERIIDCKCKKKSAKE